MGVRAIGRSVDAGRLARVFRWMDDPIDVLLLRTCRGRQEIQIRRRRLATTGLTRSRPSPQT